MVGSSSDLCCSIPLEKLVEKLLLEGCPLESWAGWYGMACCEMSSGPWGMWQLVSVWDGGHWCYCLSPGAGSVRAFHPILPRVPWVWRALPAPSPDRPCFYGPFMVQEELLRFSGLVKWFLEANLVYSLVPPGGNSALQPHARRRKAAHGSTHSCQMPLTLLLSPFLRGSCRLPPAALGGGSWSDVPSQ